jgi:hypothetical protein
LVKCTDHQATGTKRLSAAFEGGAPTCCTLAARLKVVLSLLVGVT